MWIGSLKKVKAALDSSLQSSLPSLPCVDTIHEFDNALSELGFSDQPGQIENDLLSKTEQMEVINSMQA